MVHHIIRSPNPSTHIIPLQCVKFIYAYMGLVGFSIFFVLSGIIGEQLDGCLRQYGGQREYQTLCGCCQGAAALLPPSHSPRAAALGHW